MLPRNHPDRLQITFDNPSLVADAGLLLPVTLARHVGLPQLVHQRWIWAMPGPGEHGRQGDDPGGVCAGWGRLH